MDIYSCVYVPRNEKWFLCSLPKIEEFWKNIVNERYGNLKDFEGTLRYMNSADRDTQDIRDFRKERILKADVYRKENFGDTFPLLNNILKIYE